MRRDSGIIMNNYGDWKKTEDMEIDILELLKSLGKKWWKIILCALFFGMLFGIYGYENDRKQQEALTEGQTEKEIELTEEEQQRVEDAAALESEIEGLKEYLENSVLMQIDPFHKYKAVMLYSIEQAEWTELQKISESYLSFLLNGEAAEELIKSDKDLDLNKNSLDELISAYQRSYSQSYQIVLDYGTNENVLDAGVFYVEITGKDAEMAEQLALDMQNVLKEYSYTVQKMAGKHRLVLLSEGIKDMLDGSLQTQQHDKRALLTTSLASLKTMTDAFNEAQMAVYQKAVGRDEGAEDEKETESKEDVRLSIKYILCGFLFGGLLSCCVYVYAYLAKDTLKSVQEVKRRYSFPLYGSISFAHTSGRNQSDVLQNVCTQETEKLLNRIRLSCRKHGITKICAASDAVLEKQEKACIESAAKQLKREGIELILCESIGTNTDNWDLLSETGAVLQVFIVGLTTHQAVDDAMEFYAEHGIDVLGAVAFIQNKENRTCE